MTAMPPTPPVELEAERALLGAFLLEPNLLGPYVETLPSELFFKEACRYVWEAIRTLYGADQGIDAITVAAELRRVGRFEDAGGHSFLAVLQEEATVATQVESYVRLVQAAATKRELLALGGRLVHGTENGDAVETLCADIRTTLDWVAADRSGHTPAEPLGIGLGEFLGRDFPPLEPIVEGLLYTDGGGWIGGRRSSGSPTTPSRKRSVSHSAAPCVGATGSPSGGVCSSSRKRTRRRPSIVSVAITG
jgi:DnaB-like helicase N terminal domain